MVPRVGYVILISVLMFTGVCMWCLSRCWSVSDEVRCLYNPQIYLFISNLLGCLYTWTMLLRYVTISLSTSTNLLLCTKLVEL